MSQPQQAERQNLILASLTKGNYAALEPHLETVEMTQRTVLYEVGATIRHVYFPRT
ncbi:MAG TPA: hypothetical protein VJ805_00305 [Nitrospiraceae bacterium]|nr:hypothetical protein [Nitrospiraceae bacterium]